MKGNKGFDKISTGRGGVWRDSGARQKGGRGATGLNTTSIAAEGRGAMKRRSGAKYGMGGHTGRPEGRTGRVGWLQMAGVSAECLGAGMGPAAQGMAGQDSGGMSSTGRTGGARGT